MWGMGRREGGRAKGGETTPQSLNGPPGCQDFSAHMAKVGPFDISSVLPRRGDEFQVHAASAAVPYSRVRGRVSLRHAARSVLTAI
jgi:hypothetical protein